MRCGSARMRRTSTQPTTGLVRLMVILFLSSLKLKASLRMPHGDICVTERLANEVTILLLLKDDRAACQSENGKRY